MSPSVDEVVAQVTNAGLHGIGTNAAFLAEAGATQKVHAAGLTLHVWTVDDADEARELITLGVDGLITNRPGWLREQLAAMKGAPPA